MCHIMGSAIAVKLIQPLSISGKLVHFTRPMISDKN